MPVKACIFDLDGVIVDTAKYHFLAWKRLADELGISFTKHDNELLKGVSRIDSLEIILSLGGVKLSVEKIEELAERKNKWYVEFVSRMTPGEILPGVLDFLIELREKKIKTAIGSASKNTPMIIQRTGIMHLFDAVADGNNVGKAKPDPQVFLKASEMIGIPAPECVVFEDAAAGVEAALRAGMICVGIGSRNILDKAHLVIGGLTEMNYNRLKNIESVKNE